MIWAIPVGIFGAFLCFFISICCYEKHKHDVEEEEEESPFCANVSICDICTFILWLPGNLCKDFYSQCTCKKEKDNDEPLPNDDTDYGKVREGWCKRNNKCFSKDCVLDEVWTLSEKAT
jgi:hypothetical protein